MNFSWRTFGLLTCLALCGAGGSAVFAGDFSEDALGTTGAQFLELPAQARGAAMGSAQGAAVEGAGAIYYNPGALAGVRGISATFMHALYFQDVSYDFAAVALRTKTQGTIAFGAQYLAVGSVGMVDNTGNSTGDSLAPRDLAFSAANARAIGRLEYGLGVKYISSRLKGTASAYAADAGLRWNAAPAAFSLGVSNLGPGLKFREETSPLPTTIRVGSSYKTSAELSDTTWVFALDGVFPKGAAAGACAGIELKNELTNTSNMAFRFGYNTRAGAGGAGGLSGLTGGAGLDLDWFSVDYAFAPFGSLGDSHLLSLSVRFGGGGETRLASSPVKRAPAPVKNREDAAIKYFEPGSEAVVAGDTAMLHAYPDDKSEQLEVLEAGIEVEVQSQLGKWTKVVSESGTTGWLYSLQLNNN
ncbi:MAG: hypothetical protein A2016_03640 [Elusimicrobia bacterium GWF2_62_30]|nr:MAG: hypothetical protein A2016_03640 [Elusimicrobia bacterium GWF2_62_30]